MSTEFMTHLPPPGLLVKSYDPSKSYHDQPQDVPSIFLEAMSVRELVFVQEQKVLLENEFDTDDARSWHWVTYVSVGSSSKSSVDKSPALILPPSPRDKSAKRNSSTAHRLAVGTVRLVPPPHPPHPTPGTTHSINLAATIPLSESRRDSATNNAHEPYVKLGRLAILAPYRKLGLARLLVEGCLEWAAAHPEEIVPSARASSIERQAAQADDDESARALTANGAWKGLVLVHAQKHLEFLYARWSFVKDDTLGTWFEEGIEHIGMWRRLSIKERR